ncbi:MAG: lipoyl(octanoyl) transferase LipB [Verrucomicrobiales bacterium]|nr:lipoyl(octanoyl) transferase LipB [Verrucomicrobiales bacterium]
MEKITFQYPGLVHFEDSLALQQELVEKIRAGEIGDTCLLLEHEPVYTIGRTRDRSSLAGEPDSLPFPVVEINRGGQATFHGPGQLVGYLLLDLHRYGQDLHTFLRAIEEALIDFLQNAGIEQAGRREGLTGVWVENRKIASIGVGVRKWISMHGFALNISRDLSGFESIIPCGIQDVTMTSLEQESGRDWTVEKAAQEIEPFISAAMNRLALASPS